MPTKPYRQLPGQYFKDSHGKIWIVHPQRGWFEVGRTRAFVIYNPNE